MQQTRQTWHPSYWKNEVHGSAWDRVKEALKRDWEQTKSDLGVGGKDLDQDVPDTVKQMAGKEPIPGPNTPNAPTPTKKTDTAPRLNSWDDIEPAYSYGVAARHQYGTQYNNWDTKLETQLASDWDREKTGRSFEEVKPYVRRAWDYKS